MLFQLQGDEVPEKWILWKKDFKKKIVTKRPNWYSVFLAFIDLTSKVVSMVIHDVFQEFNISKTDDVKINYTAANPDYGPFHVVAACYSDDAPLSRASGRFGLLFSSSILVGDIDGYVGSCCQ